MREKRNWKNLSGCFKRAAKLGLSKFREQKLTAEFSVKGRQTEDAWIKFEMMAERFERQRLVSDSGMAFLFSEGALVDALRKGKW